MHEIKLTEHIVDILEKETSDPEVGRVKKVFMEVGELRFIVPEIMISAFKAAPKSDKLKEAELDIKVLPVKVKCSECGVVSETKKTDLSCPVCSSGGTGLMSGNELIIKGIEW